LVSSLIFEKVVPKIWAKSGIFKNCLKQTFDQKANIRPIWSPWSPFRSKSFGQIIEESRKKSYKIYRIFINKFFEVICDPDFVSPWRLSLIPAEADHINHVRKFPEITGS
jgi:hypothetical protein